MKNKILLVFTLIISIFVSACSCDKFDVSTYTSAVKNYKESIGVDYDLVVTKTVKGSDKITSTESSNVFEFTANRKVKNFASTTKVYEIVTSNVSANGDPEKINEFSRYFIDNTQQFHTIFPMINNRKAENITYEDKYDITSEYHLDNLIPMFSKDQISSFDIKENKSKDGHSIATFVAACPVFANCSKDTTKYTVYIDRDYYFTKIEFDAVSDKETSSFVYTFNKYNSDAKVVFPSDLIN